MRLRFLWINYYEEASKAAGECYQQNQLSVPQLSDCLLPAVGCVTLVSLWIVPELLKGELVTVGDPLTMQQLCISMVQAHFLSAVLPVKITQSWNSWQTTNVSHLLDKAMVPQDTPREPRLKCFPEFESTVLDTPQQNNLVMIVLSELSSMVNRKKGDLSMWEDQFRKDLGNLMSFEEMFFFPEKEKMVLQDCLDGRNKIGYSVNSHALGLPTVSVGCAHSIFTLQNRLRLKPPVLEVATVDEALCCSRMPSLRQDLKTMTTELFLHVDHVQLSSLTGLLETDLTELASNLFSFRFPMQLESINDLFLRLSGEAHQLLWKFVCHEDVCENLSMSLVAGCQKHLPVFELPVPFWEIKKSVASWGLKRLLNVVDISWQGVHAPETSDSAHLEQFEALVVMPELVLGDYVFSSLPVPTIKGKERGCIATDVMLEALCLCKHSVPLALDFLYLDWHFSHKKDCGKHSCFVLESKIHEVERCELVKYVIPQFESVDIDSAFNKKEINLEKKCSLERKSPAFSPKQSCSLDSRESVCPLLPAHQAESPDKGHRAGDGTPPDPVSKHLGSSIVEASVTKPKLGNMFACNDLTFFLQARHGTVNALSTFGNSVQQEIPEVDNASVDEKMTDFHVHDILLSEPILRLRGFLELDYCRILEGDANLAFQLQPYRVLNKLCTDTDAKVALIMLIKERACKQHNPHEQQLLRGLIALYILQQTAENLFMYGVQVGLLYMESWYLNLRFLQDLVCFSYVELEEAYKQVEKGLLLDHPKLICLGNIIERHKSKVLNPKFLVIAERRALFTLYKEIISCNLKPYQFDREENLLHDGSSNKNPDLFKQAVTDALLKCDCLMVPPEYITTLFPIKQFSCIVQYGDFSANDGGDVKFDSDKWASEVHTFQITTKEHDCMAKGDVHIPYSGATQQDARRPCTGAMLQEVLSQDLANGSAQQSMRKNNSKLQNELATEASASSHNKPEIVKGLQAKDVDAVEHDNTSASIFPVTGLVVGKQPSVYKQCDMNIVVNINQLYKHLLSGQRNSYQKILAFEKHGLHVIERDLFLPIDLILSPAVCLIWYTQEKLVGSEPTSSQTLQLSCIEDITNDVMKALSFSFKTCVMVFEGSFNFVAEALQTFGYLHAAAIGLDIQLQCFISGSSSTTDMIIAKCIGEVRRSKKATSFPAMLEAKTFAESFLTEFASINPLTAHAILSCGVGLRQFMSLKVEEQLSLTESFDLNERSLLLFKQQCQSGSSGRICRGSKWVCSDDSLSVDQSKMRNFVSTSSKVRKLDEDLTLCKRSQIHAADENEWCSERTLRKAALHAPDDFLLPECDLWPVDKTDIQDEKHAQFRGGLADMSPSKGELQSVDLPVQKVRTCCVPSNCDTKLKRTMDLILKRNAHIVEKEGYQNASGTKSCSKPPANKDVRSSLYAFDQSSSQKKRLYFSAASGLDPELDPENIMENDTPQDDDVGSSVYAHDQSSSQKRWHCFPVASKLSPELNPAKIFENDTSQECDIIFLSQQGQSKAMEANMGDIFEYQLHKDTRQSHKECPVEFANETRAHLKRKLNFESPATVKHFKRRPLEGQKNSKPNFFDKYRYEGKAKQYQPESAGAYSERFSCRNLYNSPHQDAYCEKRLGCVQRSPCSVQRNACINSQRCSCGAEHQPKRLCPSWTPVDKRSKKVLSFARKGNDRQSRLVWESSKDATKQPKALPEFEDSFY